MAGITADACTGYLPEDHYHHQEVADQQQLVGDQYNLPDSTDPLQLVDKHWNSSYQNQKIDDSQTFLDGVAVPQSSSEPSTISGTQSEYVPGMLVDGVTTSQSSSEPSSSAGIQGPRHKKWTYEEMSKLLDAIQTFRERPRMWEDIRREFFNGSGRTVNSLKQKFKDMGKAANSMSGPKGIYLRARDLAASIRDEKNRNRSRNR